MAIVHNCNISSNIYILQDTIEAQTNENETK